MDTAKQNVRIDLADALRGFALMGILVVNISSFVFTYDLSAKQQQAYTLASFDHISNFLINLLFTGKFYSIFGLLFGWGFSLQLVKQPLIPSLIFYKRRLVMLFFIGLLHLLLWEGDILLLYALLGFVLLPLRNWGNKSLLALAALCILSPIGWYALKMNYPTLDMSGYVYEVGYYLDSIMDVADENELLFRKQHHFVDMLRINISGIFYRYGYLLYTSRIWKVLGVFCIGVVLGRTNILAGLSTNRIMLFIVLFAGLIIGLPANYFMAVLMDTPGYYQRTTHGLLQTICFAVGVVPLAFAYCAGFILIYYTSTGKKILSVLAPAGKMALTNYIFQTIICIFIFYGFGLNFHYQSTAVLFVMSVCIFCLQTVLSMIWLQFFKLGLLEWLWRSATYKKLVSIRQ